MAGTDGISLARTIRQRKPGLPVLLVTGYSDRAAEAGTEFILMQKPVENSELSRTVARMIADAKQPPDANIVRLHPSRRSP
jgi:DNA-binding LytR/AlgR family response regulator